MNIAEQRVVSIHYEVKDEDGVVVDSSEGREPLVYLHGHKNIIPGLEKALDGLDVGEAFDVTVTPEEAYGDYQDGLVQSVPKDAFQGVEKVEEGMVFTAQTQGGPLQVTVTQVEDDTVTVDGNHPLAGKSLSFKGEVAEVREATAEELEHGHVHDES
ncbi:peptidylprolyl isomerase [Saccharospirillum salsuginis]|uniref:Peptidyl-prolyl cis-trans isomerase n=1 Tax=Saccharospirillum salsuginis TaxID=418750 RepID=A0A918NIW0_9GAMM|nr:peptidylprolyl isomerase [Saccharospirillum salsuginis]GGX73386.1 peptidyl-prolyl cis-trans isomerase [Saccharospirillum salsuginis]